MIDVRSDTVTRPGPAMLEAMQSAEVGDDVLGEDPTVNALQSEAATLFGKEAALFCPSGTMTNQIAIKLHTQPGDEVLCDQLSHVYLYEGGGIAFHSGASVRLLAGDRGRFTASQVRANVNSASDAHYPRTRLVTIENTVNKGGGACWSLDEVRRIRGACDELGLALHLDGARLFNALVARGESPRDYGALFDTISICLSKGLGAPVGSLLLGSREHIARAHRLRKVFGGGMRQAGFLAAAGRYALAHNVARLATDHARAAAVGSAVARLPFVAEVLPVETNIVIFRLGEASEEQALLAHLRSHGVLAATMGRRLVRFVMHLDLAEDDVGALIGAVSSFH
ncbi:MAG: aminotransferase class I/II-fold pyridoxal phosphate-dependent enzyme [Proteobacteria bacterium]|nr:aminotransferase class I/II-fold pyridoxal phosphate-dependent enzyme [Pseudomonadota bacterium]